MKIYLFFFFFRSHPAQGKVSIIYQISLHSEPSPFVARLFTRFDYDFLILASWLVRRDSDEVSKWKNMEIKWAPSGRA
jgi:hypothetical protein